MSVILSAYNAGRRRLFGTMGMLLPGLLLVWLVRVPPAQAEPKPLTKEEQAKVDKAIDRAVDFLKRKQTDEGTWSDGYKDYLVGRCLLPAYALLEAGVRANDPVIQKAVEYIRPKILETDQTYELSLGVLFFDRLGDPKDKKLIQTLALRLIAGQHYTGGWSYYCPAADPVGARDHRVHRLRTRTYRCPLLKSEDEETLMKLLGELNKRLESGEKPTAKLLKELDVPRTLQFLTVFQDRRKLTWREVGPERIEHRLDFGATDNSNSQFAMLALWVAQRHAVPVCPTFDLMFERFERSQRPNGWWPYSWERKAPTRSMICVGLLGLAVGRGLKLSSSSKYPQEAEDTHVLKGLVALYDEVGAPTGQMEKPVPPQDVYFLWSLERVGMLYNLPTIGDKEWYRWGAEMLVTNQKRGGEWGGAPLRPTDGYSGYGEILNTAFGLLFLKRSHPMKDLTPKLPFAAKELNLGIARLRPSAGNLDRPITSPSQSRREDP